MEQNIFIVLFLGFAPLLALLNTFFRLWRNSFSTYISSVCMGIFSISNPQLEWYNALLLLTTLVILEIRAIKKPMGDRFLNFKGFTYG